MKRPAVALWIWYRGAAFNGFQAQPQGRTVQGCLQAALREAGVLGSVMPASRTDRGVHARMQVVSLRLDRGDSPEALEQRLSCRLPEDLGLCAARRPAPSFHAQWSSVGKEYRYRVHLEGPARPSWAGSAFAPASDPRWTGRPVRPERLDELLRCLEGTRDFGAFHARSSVRKARTLASARLVGLGGGLYEARLVGDAFARYQVRCLVGAALLVAGGLLAEEQLRLALERAEPFAGFRAPAAGLVLWEVRYPPALDPFTRAEREAPPGLPADPPFAERSGPDP